MSCSSALARVANVKMNQRCVGPQEDQGSTLTMFPIHILLLMFLHPHALALEAPHEKWNILVRGSGSSFAYLFWNNTHPMRSRQDECFKFKEAGARRLARSSGGDCSFVLGTSISLPAVQPVCIRSMRKCMHVQTHALTAASPTPGPFQQGHSTFQATWLYLRTRSIPQHLLVL